MDALAFLKKDHDTVEQLFKRFEKAGDSAHKSKRQIVDKVIRELSMHAAVEEQVFYPALRDLLGEKRKEDVLEALEEHHVVKTTLNELEKMSAEDERFAAKTAVLIESVRHHVKEEEKEMFPKVRKALTPAQLRELGDALATAKKAAPTRPHPKMPDEPPGNLFSGPAAAAADRARDAGGRLMRKAS